MILAFGLAHALAADAVATPQCPEPGACNTCDPLAASGTFITPEPDSDPVILPIYSSNPGALVSDDERAPLLVINGVPHFPQNYASLNNGNVLATVPGYANGKLRGASMQEVTFLVDGVVVENDGKLSAR